MVICRNAEKQSDDTAKAGRAKAEYRLVKPPSNNNRSCHNLVTMAA
jgi:hypothetical protein